jgi:hypothetical protein
MSGGCDWPRYELSKEDHARLRQDLLARGVLGLDAPLWVATRDDYQDWRFSLRWKCTPEAARAWRRELIRAHERLADLRRTGASPGELDAIEEEKRRLLQPQEWARAFDSRR